MFVTHNRYHYDYRTYINHLCTGYGYRSIEQFVEAAKTVKSGEKKASDYNYVLASLHTTFGTTAILEAGRRSLDAGGKSITIKYDDNNDACRPTGFGITM